VGRTAERTRQRWANANHHSTVADAPCLTLLLLLTLFVGGRLVADGTIVGQDSATQFYPWYSYLGERLHSFQIPEWNPAQFGGAPFAADPQSGWAYLPAMVLFTLFPLALATNAFLLVHLALAGFATYGLARTLGLRPLGALVAAVAYEFSGLVANRSVCCPAQIQVAAWMPLLLLGAEIALRRTDWPARARWWGVAGLALSQILASWLGQVGYYALLVLGSYVAYRTLLAPVAEPRRSLRGRVWLLVLNGCAIFAFGFGLAAAGLLPRLAYNVHSNVAGGIYANGQSYAAVVGGWPEGAAEIAELGRSFYYPGGAVLVLGLAAIVLARERGATPYFLSLAACALVLSSHNQTLLHWVLYRLLPQFQALHEHRPERVAIVAFLAPAMLAGATVDALPSALHSRRRLRVAAALPLLGIVVAAAVLWRPGVPIPWLALVPAIAAIVVMLASVGIRRASVRRPLPAVLLVIVGLDLVLAGPRIMAAAPYGGFHRVDVEDYYRASGAVRFLQEREAEEPFRFFGYNPDASATDGGWEILYRDQFADPATAALIVNNRATVFRLQDVQGYNPVQLERFVDYMTALNGHPQEYHDANVYPEGLESPLLDLLNVRYVVVPANSQRDDIRRLVTSHPVVYRDAEV
jgi:hypothetical protein